MTFSEIASFLRKDPACIRQFVGHTYPPELGKVAHIDREWGGPSIVMQDSFKDFYYLADHDVYLLIEKAQTRSGETDYYLGQWRLKQPVIG